ncbi:MAG: universal stress protein [Nocardioides sp.]|nr:universal stress protein [Nocardioides sp.]
MNTQTRSIVVGYDGSPDADAAASWAGRMAHRLSAPVVVAIVVDRMESPRRPDWPESWWEELEERARGTLTAAGTTDVTIERHRSGVVPTLVTSSRDASMLVLGSHGHGRIGGALLGSVSQAAARHARCPVVVVRPARNASQGRIVVGADGSESSRRALDFACRQAAVTHETVVLLRAWKPLTLPIDKHGDVPASMSRTQLEEDEALLKSVAEARGQHPTISIEGEFIAERAGQALVDASAAAAMVVVGSRSRSALAATVLGSVSHHVLHHAHCPVAVVR